MKGHPEGIVRMPQGMGCQEQNKRLQPKSLATARGRGAKERH